MRLRVARCQPGCSGSQERTHREAPRRAPRRAAASCCQAEVGCEPTGSGSRKVGRCWVQGGDAVQDQCPGCCSLLWSWGEGGVTHVQKGDRVTQGGLGVRVKCDWSGQGWLPPRDHPRAGGDREVTPTPSASPATLRPQAQEPAAAAPSQHHAWGRHEQPGRLAHFHV